MREWVWAGNCIWAELGDRGGEQRERPGIAARTRLLTARIRSSASAHERHVAPARCRRRRLPIRRIEVRHDANQRLVRLADGFLDRAESASSDGASRCDPARL